MFKFLYQLSLIGTFLVLIWYTVETYKIRKITTTQKDIQLLPTPMLYFENQHSQERVKIKNIGLGAAIGVRVENYEYVIDKETNKFVFNLEGGNNVLAQGEERRLGINYLINGKANNAPNENFWAQFNSDSNSASKARPKNIKIKFQDVTGQHYEMTVGFSKEGIAITKPPARTRG